MLAALVASVLGALTLFYAEPWLGILLVGLGQVAHSRARRRRVILTSFDPGRDVDDEHVAHSRARRRRVILISFDPGRDVDDELAFLIAMGDRRFCKARIIWVVNKGSKSRLFEILHLQGLSENDIPDSWTITTIEDAVSEGVVYTPEEVYCISTNADALLKIVDVYQVCHVRYMGNLPLKVKQSGGRFHLEMDYVPDDTVSFNDTNSEAFLQSLPDTCTVRVITTKEAWTTPKARISKKFCKIHGIKPDLRKRLYADGFTAFVGRMCPNNEFAEKFAEHLINPALKGSTYKFARSLVGDDALENLPRPSQELIDAVKCYCTEINVRDPTTEDRLMELCLMIAHLIKVEPIDPITGRLFVSTRKTMTKSGELVDAPVDLSLSLESAFVTFQDCEITPAFDVLALGLC